LLEETCFQQARSSMVEGSSQAVLESSEQRKVELIYLQGCLQEMLLKIHLCLI
jgi:hypothetical protein